MLILNSLCRSHSWFGQTYTPLIARIKKCALVGNNAECRDSPHRLSQTSPNLSNSDNEVSVEGRFLDETN